jgi:hypothetical protein
MLLAGRAGVTIVCRIKLKPLQDAGSLPRMQISPMQFPSNRHRYLAASNKV